MPGNVVGSFVGVFLTNDDHETFDHHGKIVNQVGRSATHKLVNMAHHRP